MQLHFLPVLIMNHRIWRTLQSLTLRLDRTVSLELVAPSERSWLLVGSVECALLVYAVSRSMRPFTMQTHAGLASASFFFFYKYKEGDILRCFSTQLPSNLLSPQEKKYCQIQKRALISRLSVFMSYFARKQLYFCLGPVEKPTRCFRYAILRIAPVYDDSTSSEQ